MLYQYDGSLDGLLCTADEVIGGNVTDYSIASENCQLSLFDNFFRIASDPARAEKFWNRLDSVLENDSMQRIVYCHMSEAEGYERHLVEYLRLGMKLGPSLDSFHADTNVGHVLTLSRKFGRELHAYKGLCRFRKLEGDIYYAPIEPECNIIQSLAEHFRCRLAVQKWLIHDIRRGLAVYWDMKSLHDVETDLHPSAGQDAGTDDEKLYADMWRTFHRTIAIKERENPNLQRQNMPKRYWKYLTEKM